MRATIIQNILDCLALSLVGSLGSIGVASLGSLALWDAFTTRLPLIATLWPGLNGWLILDLLVSEFLASMLLGIMIASIAIWWIADCFEAKR